MRHRRNRIAGQFSARLTEMLESCAYRALSLAGRRVLDRIEIEHSHHGGNDNGKLPVTFNQFCEYGLHRHSIAPGVREAVALGFLEITQRGRAGNAEYRSPNYFRLTYRSSAGVKGDGSHDWRRISTMEEAASIAEIARKAKAPKKTKTQCRKTPAFGDKNRHRKPNFPVTKTGTRDVAKTGTTSISRDIPSEPAREARPSGSAVASEPATTASEVLPPRRLDHLHSHIAAKLGPDGWNFITSLSENDLAALVQSEESGSLNAELVQKIRLRIRLLRMRGAA